MNALADVFICRHGISMFICKSLCRRCHHECTRHNMDESKPLCVESGCHCEWKEPITPSHANEVDQILSTLAEHYVKKV